MSSRAIHPAPSLYDTDFLVWTAESARLLRERRFTDIEVDNVAEEIEDLGRYQKREVESRLTLILIHLLKWTFQKPKRSRSWRSTVNTQRIELAKVIERSPSFKSRLGAIVGDVYRDAVHLAGIQTGLDQSAFPSKCPWTSQQILDRDFWPV